MFPGERSRTSTVTSFDALASITAGLWECDLATETLVWSRGVYALFGMEPGAPVDRRKTLACYDTESRIAMECLRVAAIRDRTGFTLDALIHGCDGQDRWIRITGRVVCEQGRVTRLVGSKHDVTGERHLWGTRMAPPAMLYS